MCNCGELRYCHMVGPAVWPFNVFPFFPCVCVFWFLSPPLLLERSLAVVFRKLPPCQEHIRKKGSLIKLEPQTNSADRSRLQQTPTRNGPAFDVKPETYNQRLKFNYQSLISLPCPTDGVSVSGISSRLGHTPLPLEVTVRRDVLVNRKDAFSGVVCRCFFRATKGFEGAARSLSLFLIHFRFGPVPEVVLCAVVDVYPCEGVWEGGGRVSV